MPHARVLRASVVATASAVALLLTLGAASAAGQGKRLQKADATVAGPVDAISGYSGSGGMSTNGRFVVEQIEIQVVPGSNSETRSQVVLFDGKRGETRLVSRSTRGDGVGNALSYAPDISRDGRAVVFASYATDLVDDGTTDDNDVVDIFLYDIASGTTRLVSKAAGTEQAADGLSYSPVFSADGTWILFTSSATNLTTEGPGVTSGSASRRNLFAHELATGRTLLVTANSAGTGDVSGSLSGRYRFSGDGRHALFSHTATDLVTGTADGSSTPDLFLRDLREGTTLLVSALPDGSAVGSVPGASSDSIGISADGRFVVYQSPVDGIVPNDTNGRNDVFRRDLVEESTLLVTANAARTGAANMGGYCSSVSADTRMIVFTSGSTDLGFEGAEGGTDEFGGVYVYDAAKDTTTLVSHRRGDARTLAGGYAFDQTISPNGRYLLFSSTASDLVRKKTDEAEDLFLYDVRRRKIRQLTRVAKGLTLDTTSHYFGNARISASGRIVSFVTAATDFDKKDTDQHEDLYVLRAR